MGRGATKAADNVWYKARIEAAKADSRLRSREGAAEVLGMSVSAVSDAELGLGKTFPVDKAVVMSTAYRNPLLLNHYCKNECPIGGCKKIPTEAVGLETASLKLISLLRNSNVEKLRDDISGFASGELDDADEAIAYIDKLMEAMSEYKLSLEMGGRKD